MAKSSSRRIRRVSRPAFVIRGLHGTSDVHLPLSDPAVVFVGPNGLGKSTIVSCFYLCVSFQWTRLAGYPFEEIEYQSRSGRDITITRAQCAQYGRQRTRVGSMVERIERTLAGTADLDLLTSGRLLSPLDYRRIAGRLGIPSVELDRFRASYIRQLKEDPDIHEIVELEALLKDEFPGQILFLPTYRRIEQDFRALFPQLLEQLKRYGDDQIAFDRKTDRYHEIIQFGMEDIQALWTETSASLQGYAKTQLSSLMSNYLRDVIRGEAAGVDTRFFRDIKDQDIEKVLSRVEENALSLEDQDVLRSTVQSLRQDTKPGMDALYLGYFFQRLSSVVSAIEERESRVRSMVDTLNSYFKPTKHVTYDPVTYAITIDTDHNTSIELGSLSSGEKQIVSLFSILFLGNSSDHWIIIDEPELSLSVPWQEMFLDDIYNNPKCRQLIAVTHSPFVYANSLRSYAKDISRFISRAQLNG